MRIVLHGRARIGQGHTGPASRISFRHSAGLHRRHPAQASQEGTPLGLRAEEIMAAGLRSTTRRCSKSSAIGSRNPTPRRASSSMDSHAPWRRPRDLTKLLDGLGKPIDAVLLFEVAVAELVRRSRAGASASCATRSSTSIPRRRRCRPNACRAAPNTRSCSAPTIAKRPCANACVCTKRRPQAGVRLLLLHRIDPRGETPKAT